MAKSREERKYSKAKREDERDISKKAEAWNKMDTPEAGAPIASRMPDLEGVAKRALEAQTSSAQEGTTRPSEAPHEDHLDMPGGYSYRLYKDGAIEIIGVPAGEEFQKYLNTFPKTGGSAFVAIEGQIKGKSSGTPEPEVDAIEVAEVAEVAPPQAEVAPPQVEDETLGDQISALQPARATVGSFVEQPGDEYDAEGSLIPSGLKRARNLRMEEQIEGMKGAGPELDLGALTAQAVRNALGREG